MRDEPYLKRCAMAAVGAMDPQRLLPEPPRTQALSSKTFSVPPLDGSLTLPEMYDWHLKNSPDHPLFVFSRENGEVRTILWPEAVRAIHNGARLVRRVMGWKAGMQDVAIVAILASSDTITYFTMIMSIMRAGYIAFPISPRNSPEAVAHLISKVAVKHIFVGREQALTDLHSAALKILESKHSDVARPNSSPFPVFEELFVESCNGCDDVPYEKRGSDEIVMYMHSSGSTAFPKAIPWRNLWLNQLALHPYFGERDLTSVVFSLHSIPMYHGMGAVQLSWAASCGLVMATFEPKYPPQIPTPQSHFQAAVSTQSDVIYCVPAIIEAWSRVPEYVQWLATRKGVLYGGGPLNKAVGDYLTSQGVSIYNLYGSTEGGIMSPVLAGRVGYDWDYFKFPGNVVSQMVPHGDGTYELVLIDNLYSRPSVTNTKVSGVDAYATSDLFTEHPQKPGHWRIYGRTDDQIMHSTGEKTNPGPLENMLNQDPNIQSSVMFGRGQFQAGVIIDPKSEFKFDPSDQTKLASFRNKIWPTVQRMNEFAPQHSRLFKEMIIVSRPSKPFQYTAKSTARRQTIINDYAEEIQATYHAVADSAQSSIPPPAVWDSVGVLDFVRSVVGSVLCKGVKDDDDIFQYGCDSLQATWIRNTVLRALRDSARIETRQLGDSLIYSNPTISTLAFFLESVVAGICSDGSTKIGSRAANMRSMAEKYASDLPLLRTPTLDGFSEETKGDVVLVTGTTGALGCYILAELVNDPAVTRVYAVNRPSSSCKSSVRERQFQALVDRGLNAKSILGSDKVKFLEATLHNQNFGLAEDQHRELRSSVTHIIHNAWPVDFNLSLTSFETSIKGLRNLIDFALSCHRSLPPTLVYTSSIGIFQNVDSIHTSPLPEAPVAPEMAVGTGYTESKWVSEEILLEASKRSGLDVVIVRVGQLAGGSNGSWNTSEWVPALVQSGQICGCLPADERTVDWIQLPIAAKSIIDFRYADVSSSPIVHLVHPHPSSWSSLVEVLAANLSVPIVPFSEWFAKLDGQAGDHRELQVEDFRRLPALRLLQFFRSMAARAESSDNAFGFRSLSCEKALRHSSTLSASHLPQLDGKDARRWMEYWRSATFIKN